MKASRLIHLKLPIDSPEAIVGDDAWTRFVASLYKFSRDLANGFERIEPQDGIWTPTLTFATPGNLSVAYTTRQASYTRMGRLTVLQWVILTSTFTHTTALGNLLITGVPFPAIATANYEAYGSLAFQGITKAGYTQFTPKLAASAVSIGTAASASGTAGGNVAFGDVPTGGTVLHVGSLAYLAG